MKRDFEQLDNTQSVITNTQKDFGLITQSNQSADTFLIPYFFYCSTESKDIECTMQLNKQQYIMFTHYFCMKTTRLCSNEQTAGDGTLDTATCGINNACSHAN